MTLMATTSSAVTQVRTGEFVDATVHGGAEPTADSLAEQKREVFDLLAEGVDGLQTIAGHGSHRLQHGRFVRFEFNFKW